MIDTRKMAWTFLTFPDGIYSYSYVFNTRNITHKIA